MFLFKPALKTKISLFKPPPPHPTPLTRLSESGVALPVAILNLATAVKVFVPFLWQYLKLVTAVKVCAPFLWQY
jgi:hypothetical protein